jgi:hypothetical protein
MSHEQIIEKVNKLGFFATYTSVNGTVTEKAKLSGAKLDFPIVYTESGRHEEISWNLAERLATTQLTVFI